ncbi:hypothetical protein CSC26_3266 [Pseudomonas aeruginosa]|nr:hypothetical protein CSC26_3266 [Pseudomonas aeruginosa]PRW28792.1 hypothetical protein CSB96_4927 [Pseudomonas aeruginosa]RAL80551.1 hypothetical protein CSC34_0405 [Pseudomonas aeruginosa]
MAGSGATRPWPRLFFRLAAAPAWTRLLPCTRANQGGATAFSRRTLGGTGSPYQIRGKTPSKVSFGASPADV